MFIPVMDEIDIFDAHGNQICDINTLTEFIDQIVMGHKPASHPDEDDDQAHFFNVIKFQGFFINQVVIVSTKKDLFAWAEKPVYTTYKDKKLLSLEQDILIPPPKV